MRSETSGRPPTVTRRGRPDDVYLSSAGADCASPFAFCLLRAILSSPVGVVDHQRESMSMKIKFLLTAVMALALAIGIGGKARPSSSAAAITKAAQQFLASLTAEQRAKALMEFIDEERFNWFYVPPPRRGILLQALEDQQRSLAQDFRT